MFFLAGCPNIHMQVVLTDKNSHCPPNAEGCPELNHTGYGVDQLYKCKMSTRSYVAKCFTQFRLFRSVMRS